MAITNWVSDNYTTGMAKNVDAAVPNSSTAQTAPYEKIIADSFSTLPTSTGIGDGTAAVKAVSGPGPVNAGPSGPSAEPV